MGSLAHLVVLPVDPATSSDAAHTAGETSLDRAHRVLRAGAHERAHRVLDEAAVRARIVLAGAGSSEAASALGASVFVADVVGELAARGDLDVADMDVAVSTLAEVLHVPVAVAAFDLFRRVVTSPGLLELPPVTAAEIQLTLLLHLDVVDGLGVWQSDGGDLRPLLLLGEELPLGSVALGRPRSDPRSSATLRGRIRGASSRCDQAVLEHGRRSRRPHPPLGCHPGAGLPRGGCEGARAGARAGAAARPQRRP